LKIGIEKFSKQFALILIDSAFIYGSILIGLVLRFEGVMPAYYIQRALLHSIFIVPVFIILFIVFGLYSSLWEFAGSREVLKIAAACISGSAIVTFIEYFLPERLPLSVPLIACLVLILLVGGTRMLYRIARRLYRNRNIIFPNKRSLNKRAMVVGAGDAGSIIIREMLFNPSCGRRPVLAVDDDRKKNRKSIYGLKIEGSTDMIPALVKKYAIDDIIFAIPSASKNERRRILNICSHTGCNLMLMPSVTRLSDYRNFIERLRPVKIEDLLGRDEVDLDTGSISDYLKDKTILITGGGGSIGSELARQVVRFEPGKLVIMDMYENCAYNLLNELNSDDIKVNINVEIGSIRDIKRLEEIFSSYKPDVVFHAAAHKHVPFMEACPFEAVKNNVLGTLNTAKMADKYNASCFVLISTDKAVNPTSVMGATKRIAEMIIQSMDRISKTEFAAVRFGNVLGSNGSVIPLFKKQIEAGGPVTVTHPDIKRFFMTASEAAKLVIQAGAMAKGGEIFVLDMGELIKIVDLARNLISLSGFVPGEEIKIEITGLRPGEKMFEEILLDEEGIKKTCHEKIFIGKSRAIAYDKLMDNIDLLVSSIGDQDRLKRIMAEIVPTYKYGSLDEVKEVNGKMISNA